MFMVYRIWQDFAKKTYVCRRIFSCEDHEVVLTEFFEGFHDGFLDAMSNAVFGTLRASWRIADSLLYRS